MIVRLFGLRWARIGQWFDVLEVERQSLTWRNVWLMASLAFKTATGITPIDRKRVMRQFRTCCRCPLFDAKFRRCGLPGSMAGCRCYMVFAIVCSKRCWAKEVCPELGIGYV